MSLLLNIPAPMGSTSHTHHQSPHIQSTFLRDLKANPVLFGEPVGRASFAPKAGLKEVFPGPPSPPRSLLRLEPPLQSANGVEEEDGEMEDGEISDDEKKKKKGSVVEGKQQNGRMSSPAKEVVKEKEKVEQVKKVVLGPATPPHLRRPPSPGPSSLPTPTASQSAGPSVGTTPKKSANGTANGHILPSAPPTPVASSSTVGATSTSARSLHDPIADAELSFPPVLAKITRKAAGLWNPSMACYANATLQVMMHTPPFVREMIAHKNDECLLERGNKFCLLCVMREMISDHWTKKAYQPKSVHMQLNLIKKGFNRNRQEDTHEFFRFACDALQNTALAGLPKALPEAVKHTTWVHRLWGGRVRSRVVCSKCTKPSDTFDHFLDLSLDCGAGKRNITAMLQGFVKDDKLEGDNKYHCESCKGKANATKSFRIAEAPPVLTLHLKRFSMNYNSWNGKARADKYNLHIGFEEYLDIAPYMIDRTADGANTKYRLFGVTCHRGAELRFGHYTAYVRAPNGEWYQADDEDVSPVSLSDVKNDKTAYLLSYIRLAEGEEIPAGARASGHVNGNANGMVVNGNGAAGKRKREEEAENERELEARRPAKNGPGRQGQGNAMKEPIRKNGNGSSTPLFPSVHDNQPQTNGYRQTNNGNYVPRQPLPSPAPSDRTVEDDAGPSSISAFGASMDDHRNMPAPRAIPSGHFYGPPRSPIQRSTNPGPGSPRGKGRNKKNNRNARKQSNASPFHAGGAGGGGRGRGGFGSKASGMIGRMKA